MTTLNTHRMARLDLDPARLAEDLQSAKRFVFSDAYSEFSCGEWRSCMLWNGSGEFGDTLLSDHDRPALKTAYGTELPYLCETIEDNFDLGRLRFARLVNLRPNSVLIPHRDFLELGKRLRRIHIPLRTDSKCFNGEENVVYQMKVGEVWFIDAAKVHTAASFSTQDRLHLILDFAQGEETAAFIKGPLNLEGVIPEDSIVQRVPLSAADKEAIASLHKVIDRDNYKDLLALLIRKYFRTQFSASTVFDWLLSLVEQAGDRALLEEIRRHVDYFLIERQAASRTEGQPSSHDDGPAPLGIAELDQRVADLIAGAKLTSATNGFFQRAKANGTVRPGQALSIAHNWREITKAFLFTTIKGIGVMAEQATREQDPPESLLRTIQTLFTVIGDDLNNSMEVFKQVAPRGIDGIHFLWWQKTVLDPILAHCDRDELEAGTVTSPGARHLITSMEALSKSSVGTAVQLRVVEAIALEIAVAFRRVFVRVKAAGMQVFPRREDLAWMDAHIKAEVTHHRQVSDGEAGMTRIADTAAKQQELLGFTAEYVDRWARAIEDFEIALAR
jgi:hypothetical protein